MEKLVLVKNFSQREEAELAKNLLETEGIKAMVTADDYGGMNPALGWATGGAKLMVREKDKERALEILAGN